MSDKHLKGNTLMCYLDPKVPGWIREYCVSKACNGMDITYCRAACTSYGIGHITEAEKRELARRERRRI